MGGTIRKMLHRSQKDRRTFGDPLWITKAHQQRKRGGAQKNAQYAR